MSAADDLAGQIAAFDARDDAIGLVEFLQTGGQDPEQMQIAIYQLLVAKRYQSAYIVASFSIAQGARSLLSSLALAIGGFLHRNPAHAATGIELVAAQATALESSQPQVYRHLHQDILHPALLFLMSTALPAADDQRVLEVLEILKAFSAHFRRVFDWDARVEFSLDNMRQKGLSQQALLIRLASPPARSPRDRRALVVMRELIFPNQSWSRALDVGPRIAQAMNSYGWQCDFHPLRCANLRAEAQEIVERCLQSKVDVLVFDEDIMMMALPERTDLTRGKKNLMSSNNAPATQTPYGPATGPVWNSGASPNLPERYCKCRCPFWTKTSTNQGQRCRRNPSTSAAFRASTGTGRSGYRHSAAPGYRSAQRSLTTSPTG
jgi:hypothetical protein